MCIRDRLTRVFGSKGHPYAHHTVGYSGGPSGSVGKVVVRYRARSATGTGSVQVSLFDGTTLLRTGKRNEANTAYTSYEDVFDGLAVPNANGLRTRIELRNGAGDTSVIRYTQIWIVVTVSATLDWGLTVSNAKAQNTYNSANASHFFDCLLYTSPSPRDS